MNPNPQLNPPEADAIAPFIVQLLSEKGTVPAAPERDAYRYLETGHIDSLAFIKFIFQIEERFDVRFSESEILGEPIKTVGGLVALVAAKRQPA